MAQRRGFTSLESFDDETIDNARIQQEFLDDLERLQVSETVSTLMRHLSIRSRISTTSSFARHQQEATEASEPQPYKKIGAGACGVVYEQPGDPLCVKKQKANWTGPLNLQNDFRAHNIIYSAFKKYSVDIHVPFPSRFVSADDKAYWKDNQSLFPPEDRKPSDLLFTERILPLPKAVREALIEQYCPEKIKAKVYKDETSRNCLIRLYLGRVQRPRGPDDRPQMFFNLNNLGLTVDQLLALHVEVQPFITAQAKALAIMHWEIQVDARDVEFVLGTGPDSTEDHDFTPQYNFKLRVVHYWLLDFNQVHDITLDDAGVDQAVAAFMANDPYYPRPGRGPESCWISFKQEYIKQSQEILEKEHWNLATRFVDTIEMRQT